VLTPLRRLAVAGAALAIVLAGCGSTPDAPPAASSTPTPTPTAAASLLPMVQPTKPYGLPKMPAKPANADELTSIGYGVERIVWASAGVVDPKTTVSCATTNAKLVVDKATLRFDCVVTAGGLKTTFAITSTTGAQKISWDFKVARLPVTEKKVVYEASRQAYKPARVTCDIEGTELVPLGDPKAITCWVAQPDNTSVTYLGGLDDSGVITFALAPTPTPTPTPTASPTTAPSGAPTVTPGASASPSTR
jgi:hypothetical protein